MIEVAVFLCVPVMLAAFGGWAWRRVRGPARTRRALAARWLVVATAAVAFTLLSAHRVARARTFQVFGSIVPRVNVSEPVVALTFDDGPVPGPTDRVLRMLRDADVRATFFLNGQAVEEQPDEAAKIARAGHEIGNHTYSHTWPTACGRARSFCST